MAGLLDLIAARNPEQAGGLLSDLVAGPRNRLAGLLSDPSGFLQSALSDVVPTNQQAQEQLARYRMPLFQDYAMGPSEYDNKLRDIALGALTVYHGSPHKFNKFDMSKIGTGEGAQAYGHGLYFAENPQVAMDYQRKLAGADNGVAGQIAANAMRGRTPEAAIEHLSSGFRGTPESQKVTQEAIYLIKSGNANTGKLYKVDLPDESIAKMLDWDKPLKQQTPIVQEMLAANKYFKPPDGGEPLGKWISELRKNGDPELTFKELGITGIRYLDRGSRSEGKGTSNFVVFDDSFLKILERNGEKIGEARQAAGSARPDAGTQEAGLDPLATSAARFAAANRGRSRTGD